jgi:TolB-like protein/class 3 adenylate cyclase
MKQEQPVRVGRRLAAIVAADVAGYSRLMGFDEVGTARTLREHRKVTDALVAKHGGRIVKTTGDGVLLEFPSVVDAVECAVAVQAVMAERNQGVPEDRRMLYRIGINLGDILIEGDDILGDGVNVAARLEGIAEPGSICISSSAYEQVRGKVAMEFADLGEQKLKNIERPVRAYAANSKDRLRNVAPSALPSHPEERKSLPLPDKPSIAVLPFKNMSGDPEQEYFADGMVEDIITALSCFKSLFVIARNSSFTYKGKAVDIKQVGQQLGVRYVLEGSIRKSAARVRITGQLIEASTGTHLWAEKIDGDLSDVFDLQDQITAKVVSSVAPTIERAEIERSKQRTPSTTDSYDLYLRGMALVSRGQFSEARSLFKQATEQDREYAAAYAMSAWTYSVERAVKGIIHNAEMRSDALRDANTALGITTDDALVLARCAHPMAYICQQIDRADALAERAVILNSNLSVGWISRGWISLMLAKPERAIESFENLLRLSPLDPLRSNSLSGIAFGHFMLDRYDEGRRTAKNSMQPRPNHQAFATYIINCVGGGDVLEAKNAAAELLKFDPSFRVSRASDIFPTSSEMRNKIDNALRTAGVPE